MAGEVRINYEKSTRDIEDSRFESNVESDDYTVCVWQDNETIIEGGLNVCTSTSHSYVTMLKPEIK